MDATPPRRHFKSIFPNHSAYPGLSAAIEIPAIFRHYDTNQRQFTCTLKEDEALYDTLQLQMNEYYSNEMPSSVVPPMVKRNSIYATSVDGCWKRVRVESIDHEARQCTVEIIDDGHLLTLSVSELFILNPVFISNQYKRIFGVRFVLPRKPKRNSLAAAGFIDGHRLRNGHFVNVFVFSDREPFLALLTEAFVRIQADKLVDDLDSGSARLWALTLSTESVRCRGVAFGSYTMASLPSDIWCDVTVAAFESLENFQVRGPEQSIRLMYLERFMESAYGNEEFRDRLSFETGVHVGEGLACVAWDASNQRWVRARVICTSGDRSAVDAVAVDYPSITLRGLRFRDEEIYMLRTDLLFPPLCCSIRAINAGDKEETAAKSAVAKDVLRIGNHVRVYSPASSTLSIIELANGLKLQEYIEHAVEVDSIRRSGFGQNFSDALHATDAALSQLYLTTAGNDTHSDMTSFSSSMSGFPRTVLFPPEHRFEPFSQSLSLESQRRSLPLRCGISAFQSSLKRRYGGTCGGSSISNHMNTVPSFMPVSSSSSYQCKSSKGFLQPTVESQRTPCKENLFRKPTLVHKKGRKSSSSSVNFENDYLNKSLTSCESDNEGEAFSKSLWQKHQPRASVAVALPSPPLYNSDSYSENSDLLRHEKTVPVEILSVNCATEIFLSTAETRMQYEALKKELSLINDADLLPVSGSWCTQNEHYLFWFDDFYWARVKIVVREDDDWKLLCVDTGEEKFVKYNSRFYRLPRRLMINEWPPTCIGPLRLSGLMDARWLGVAPRIFLRGLCEKARHLTAAFGKGESDRSVLLYDEKRRCLNDQFLKFIEEQPLVK